jgi:hypothetical protein
MLMPVWRGNAALGQNDVRADLASARGRAKEEMDALSPEFRAIAKGEAKRKLVASDALVREIERIVSEAK